MKLVLARRASVPSLADARSDRAPFNRFLAGARSGVASALSEERRMVERDGPGQEDQQDPREEDQTDYKTGPKCRGVVPGRIGSETEGGNGHGHDDARRDQREADAVVAYRRRE